ncbi:MAG TPA: hypothetical protein ENI57_12220 [Ignavibacteria bacterium]|nr:hypothetical protein [Ignavibacteria bacterium]
MKKLVILFLAISFSNTLSQESGKPGIFSTFNFEALGGINFTTLQYIGPSLIIEGKTNLSSNLNIKFSLGYSTTFKKDQTNVKTFSFISINNIDKYQTSAYTIEKIEYDIIPISVGIEYFFMRGKFSPYSFLEMGYNSYSIKIHTSGIHYNIAGSYNSFNELPADYKNKPPAISDAESYRIAIGIGTNYKLSSSISLDLRYSFQYNKSLVNTHRILVGISF